MAENEYVKETSTHTHEEHKISEWRKKTKMFKYRDEASSVGGGVEVP